MIFYVYMSPAVLEDAYSGGSYALDSFIGILRGFLQNCFIVEFEDSRVQTAVYSNVSQLPASDAKKKIMLLLSELKKRKHFIYCLVPDYLTGCDDLSCVINQSDDALLDFLLVAKKEVSAILQETEIATLDNYNQSTFESNRSRLACAGKILQPGELKPYELLDRIFKKALRFTSRIEICDRIFGSKFGDNFEYTFSTLCRWLEENISDPVQLEEIIIYCEKPPGYTDEHMRTQLALVKKGRLSKIKIEIRFYERKDISKEREDVLPHDRYLMTDQVAFTIGRGMDFLSKHTRGNRDFSINYQNHSEIANLLNSYRRWMLEPVLV